MFSVQRHSLSYHLTAAVLTSAILAAVIFAGYMMWVTSHVDDLAEQREATLLQRALNDQFGKIAKEQQSATQWDDAVTFSKAGDRQWLADNLGEWMHSFYGHDQAFVLDASDAPVYAMVDGRTVDPRSAPLEMKLFSPLVADLREQIAKRGAEGDLGAADLLFLDGRPAIVSVKPIVPDSDRLTQDAGSEYLHIAVRRIDNALLARVGSRYLIDGVHYLAPLDGPTAAPTLPLTNRAGKVLGTLTWTANDPGGHIMRETLPAAGILAVIMAAILAALLTKLRRMAAQLTASKTQATYFALHDPLTTLPNRMLFNDRMGRAFARHRRTGESFALLSIDLDGFKAINDTLGHPSGDELIRQVGQRLMGLMRECDTVARLGGDEFAVIQSDCGNSRAAEVLAGRILAEMGRPFELFGEHATIAASIGVALMPDNAQDTSELIRKADIALYEAKGKGKDRFCFFQEGLNEVVSYKRAIERDLKIALETGTGLWLALQPLFAENGKTIVGAEALIRWNHPEHGLLSPAIFIPVAEERGLIAELGTFVLREACRIVKELDIAWLAVNFSALQFRDRALASKVLACLAEFGVTPSRIQIEITETALIGDFEAMSSTLAELREAGIRIALDDFGTGYSSLGYLHRCHFDKIKIDRSFISQLNGSGSTDAVVKAVMELANAFSMKVTAEGVETPSQWRELAAMGCRELQGFLFSKPVTQDEFKALLRKGDNPDDKSGVE
ncbi:putative bifunctional diguanylate cyclase/phosphodiesterase [Consotaella salsifontis]|nr:bifunctional diguanylate cyclase/phosphodiesterase [Consotaella salsifontis]